MMNQRHFTLFSIAVIQVVAAFWSVPFLSFTSRSRHHQSPPRHEHRFAFTARYNTALASGDGVATNYTWHEEAFEIDVAFQVPLNTRAKDIQFKATPTSIDLRISKNFEDDVILMDPDRKLRGRVNLDGTFWVISDSEDASANYREITVTIEKLIRTPKDDFEVVDYDWKGIYSEDADEILSRKYDEAEELDVREYAANMGVDIDNINMSMVDKTMFSSGLNLSQSALEELDKAGYITEVTQQADGSEYTVNEEGEAEPFSRFGRTVDKNEFQQEERPKIPFLDTNSPWHEAVPVEVDRETNKTYVKQVRNFTRAAFAEDSAKERTEKENKKASKKVDDSATDPIDTLTVQRLKEILKSQGMKVTGNKKELQDRLRKRVNAMLQGSEEDL